MLEWVAMITMLIDHSGLVFFSEYPILRMIGRIAFPLYSFFIIIGLERTSNKKRYFKRLFIIALISQIPFNIVFNVIGLNVVFTLLVGAISIWIYENLNGLDRWGLLIAISSQIYIFSDYMDYGWYGVILTFLYYFLKNKPVLLIGSHVILNIIYMGSVMNIQMLSIIATLFILLRNSLPVIKVPRKMYQSFYPLHLLMIAMLIYLA
jgi:hypothetical protein